MGGRSNEREVSLESGRNVAEALGSLGKYEVVEVDVTEDNLDGMPEDVDAVYIALHGGWGENGGDILKKGILEYSSNGEDWEILFEGECQAEVILTGISVNARYVRMRTGDPTDGTWVKVRAFEVNTTRKLEGRVTASTNMNIYDVNSADKLVDDDPNTIFWPTGHNGDPYVQIDLGMITAVSHVKVLSGNLSGNDKIVSGRLCYSLDGTTWVNIDASFTEGVLAVDVDIQARYIRLNIEADPGAWVAISDFSVAA